MKLNYLLLASIILMFFSFSNCTPQSSKPTNNKPLNTPQVTEKAESSEPIFPLPEVPLLLDGTQEGAIYLSKHYWDLFPFEDTTLISQPDITEQGLVDYIQLLNNIPYSHAEESLQIMMNQAKANDTMYRHFLSLFDKYFYDPNSPFRNDEFYIPIVDNAMKSDILSATDKEVYRFQQEMILKNRVGTTATDFVYTLANGEKYKMHALKSDYLILFFTNPDCPTCATVTREMNDSKTLNNLFLLNSSNKSLLTVLSIYPDSNIDEWRKMLPKMPQQNWVNACDDGTIITNKRMYDIKAIPTLYLLDKNKKILLKDTSLDEIEDYFMRIR